MKSIQNIINSPDFDKFKALKEHLKKFRKQKDQLEMLINNVRKTIMSIEDGKKMSDKEKFEGFKNKLIAESEEKYGKQIRKMYGEKTVQKLMRG